MAQLAPIEQAAASAEPADVEEAAEEEAPEKEQSDARILLYGAAEATASDADLQNAAASGGVGLGYEESMEFFARAFLRKGTRDSYGASIGDNGEINSVQQRDLGISVLDPSAANVSISLEAGYYFFPYLKKYRFKPILGVSGYLVSSNVDWSYPVTSNDETEVKNVGVTTIGGGLCGSTYGKAELASSGSATVAINGCFSFRRLGGDIAGKTALRRELLETDRRLFYGPELSLRIALSNLSIGARIMYLSTFRHDREDVDGLTDIRFIPYISGIVPLELPLK